MSTASAKLTPVLSSEEYIEQAYMFKTIRERVAEGRSAQEVLEFLRNEVLATTSLPHAVGFMLAELKHSGQIHLAFARLPHYFTPFQQHVMRQAEEEGAQFTFSQALIILEREAAYRAGSPTPAGLFVYELEVLSRNRLGYIDGLRAMESDAFFPEEWRQFIQTVRMQIAGRELAELIFARSEHYVKERRKSDPGYEPTFPVLWGEREGRIGWASRGRDPSYLFATLQRQLGYPEVPRPPKADAAAEELRGLFERVRHLEAKMKLLEAELAGDPTPFLAKEPTRPDRSS